MLKRNDFKRVRVHAADLVVPQIITWSESGDTGNCPGQAGGVCSRSTNTEPLGPFNSSLTHTYSETERACMFPTHAEATAEWSQLERHRHFGLSTATISGQVRTTHAQTIPPVSDMSLLPTATRLKPV